MEPIPEEPSFVIDKSGQPGDGRRKTRESSPEDVPLCRVVKSTRSKTPIMQNKKRTTGYLFTPSKKRKEKSFSPGLLTPSTSLTQPTSVTASTSLTPLITPLGQSHLTDEANRIFFTSLVTLRQYLNVKTQKLELTKFNKRIQQFALDDIYPKVEWLSVLVGSKEDKDVLVSGQAMEVDRV
jgi:hypothetical protein